MIGRHCLPRLLERGFDVHAVTSSAPLSIPGISWHQHNLLDVSSHSDWIAPIQPTHLLHLAWLTAPGSFWNASENLDWVDASIALFQQFRAAGGKRIVGIGSCAEYDWQSGLCDEFLTPRNPNTLYGHAKLATGEYLQAIGKSHGLSTAWARVFFLYGPYASDRRMPGVVISKLLQGDEAPCSVGQQRRDFLHVADAADAICDLTVSSVSGPVNICSGEASRICDMFNSVATHLGRRDLLRVGAISAADHEPDLIVGNNGRLRTEIHWKQRFQWDVGMADTVNWWRQHRSAG